MKKDDKKKGPPKIRCRQWHLHDSHENASICDRNHQVQLLMEQGKSLKEATDMVKAVYDKQPDIPRPAAPYQFGLFE